MIDGSTGTLMLLKSLDAKIKKNFSLDVEIMNSNKQRKKCNVKILVDDFNDNLPIFEEQFYFIDIPSNTFGDFITVKAIDNDISLKHNKVIYSLNENGMQFKINQNSGVLSIMLPLEANKLYSITVLAKNLERRNSTLNFFKK